MGRPLKIRPISDNSDLIKRSPIFTGNVSKFKKNLFHFKFEVNLKKQFFTFITYIGPNLFRYVLSAA